MPPHPQNQTGATSKKAKLDFVKCKKTKQVKINDAFRLRKSREQTDKEKKEYKPPRVEEISVDEGNNLESEAQQLEKILLQFDLNWEYGPAKGITRLERWERAKKLGLNPPDSIRDSIIEANNKCVWDQHYSNIL